MSEDATWRRCSSCKSPIGFEEIYWECNVSTCNRVRTGLFFCSVSCWEAHLPMMRHREAFAVEKRSPSQAAWKQQVNEDAAAPLASPPPAVAPAIRRRVVAAEAEADDALPRDVLVVVSKIKKYIRARSGMNTSDGVVDILSEHVRRLCVQAIRAAGEAERKTVLARDFPPAD